MLTKRAASVLITRMRQTEKERQDITYSIIYGPDQGGAPLHRPRLVQQPDDPIRVLDLGSGTGIWVINTARQVSLPYRIVLRLTFVCAATIRIIRYAIMFQSSLRAHELIQPRI